MARRCIITVGLASLWPSGTHRNRLERRPGETERETQELGKEESGIILKNVHGTDSQDKAFRCTGLTLTDQAGHAAEHWPKGRGAAFSGRPPLPAFPAPGTVPPMPGCGFGMSVNDGD